MEFLTIKIIFGILMFSNLFSAYFKLKCYKYEKKEQVDVADQGMFGFFTMVNLITYGVFIWKLFTL